MTTHKAMNASGTGSLTMHKVDSGFAQRMEGIKRGVDRRFTVISKLRDPDSYGRGAGGPLRRQLRRPDPGRLQARRPWAR